MVKPARAPGERVGTRESIGRRQNPAFASQSAGFFFSGAICSCTSSCKWRRDLMPSVRKSSFADDFRRSDALKPCCVLILPLSSVQRRKYLKPGVMERTLQIELEAAF